MLTRPSSPRLLEIARREVLEVLGPEVISDRAKTSVAMLENLLQSLSVRVAHEIAWMREEADAVEALAVEAVAVEAVAADVETALEAYRSERGTSLHLDEVQADYDRAGEVLSCTVEAALASGNEALKERAVGLLHARLAHEGQIMGEFKFVGRG